MRNVFDHGLSFHYKECATVYLFLKAKIFYYFNNQKH